MLFDAPSQAGALQSNKTSTMKILMLFSENGSIDGIHVAKYEAGSVHDLSASKGEQELAHAFIGAGLAVELTEIKPLDGPSDAAQNKQASAGFFAPVDGGKAIEAAPENKMLKRAYTRKAK